MGPSNDEVQTELLRISHATFDCIGMGGVLGPSKNHYDNSRMPRFPWSGYLLDMYGVTRSTKGWSFLLECFGLTPPTRGESKEALWKQKEQQRERRDQTWGDSDDSWPELCGHWSEYVYERRRADGSIERITRRIFHVR